MDYFLILNVYPTTFYLNCFFFIEENLLLFFGKDRLVKEDYVWVFIFYKESIGFLLELY